MQRSHARVVRNGFSGIVAGAAILACADTSTISDGNSFSTSDSAGVTIVHNGILVPEQLPEWVVEDTPSVAIGVTMGDPEYEFNRINRVTRLPGGIIGVVNGIGESYVEMRFYDSTGQHISSQGQRGDGPGEYRWINFFGGVGGDTVIANDWPHVRLNLVSVSGGYLASWSYSEERLRDFLGERASGSRESLVPLPDSGYAVRAYHTLGDIRDMRRSQSYHIVDLHRDTVFSLPRYDEPEFLTLQLSSGPMNLVKSESAEPFHVVDRERQRICAGVTAAAEIRCVDRSGGQTWIRWDYEPVQISDAYKRSVEESMRADWSGSERMTGPDIEQVVAAYTHPEHFNPWVQLLNDTDGNFWVLETFALNPSGMPLRRFRIIDPDGRQIATANEFRLPVLLQGIEIGAASVLRKFEDSLGVQRVGSFRIRKGG